MPEETPTRYGFPLPLWRAAVAEAAETLARAARERRTVTYGELCASVTAVSLFPRSWALLGLIDEACDDTFSRGTCVASLVVRASDGMPGEGYFRWAERAGFDVSDRRGFWEAEVERVFEAFAQPTASELGAR